MAKKQLKSLYFPHDGNSRSDLKIIKLRQKYGATGYGWYWMINEILFEQKTGKLPLSQLHDILEWELRCYDEDTKEKLHNFIKDSIEVFKLYTVKDDYFFSTRMLDNIKIRIEMSNKRKNAANARWSKVKEENLKEKDIEKEFRG